MKRSLLIMASVGVVACSSPTQPTSATIDAPLLLLAGVGTAETSDNPLPADTGYSISVTPTAFEVHGGTRSIYGEIRAPRGVQWRVTTVEPWITVTTASGVGSGTFTATLETNLCTGAMRHGVLRVHPSGTKITVSQDGSDIGVCPER